MFKTLHAGLIYGDGASRAALQCVENACVLAHTGVTSLESLIRLHVDEMTLDVGLDFSDGLQEFIQQYNRQFQSIEPESSLLIEVPESWEK